MNSLGECTKVNDKPVADVHKTFEALYCHIADSVERAMEISLVVGGECDVGNVKLSAPPMNIEDIQGVNIATNLRHIDEMLADMDMVLEYIKDRLGIVSRN